jgi:glycosyltransferase involved in cell wall biosynthesis
MIDPEFINMVDHFVYVSSTQLNGFLEKLDISHVSNHVIKNAIETIEYKPKPQNKLRLIYISTPQRGLDVLLDAWKLVKQDNTELVVYSSTIIYGQNYRLTVGHQYEHILNRCKTEAGVVYKGYATNKAVRMALQQSHILAYPSTYIETSCLAAIEAGAAGCKIVTTDLGALPETCGEYAEYVPYNDNKDEPVKNYADKLSEIMSKYNHDDEQYIEQSRWFNEQYSWENRKLEWQEFFEKICVK